MSDIFMLYLLLQRNSSRSQQQVFEKDFFCSWHVTEVISKAML